MIGKISQLIPTKPPIYESPSGLEQVIVNTVNNAVSWGLGIVAILAVVFIIYGGFRMVAAAGNEEQVKAGRETIIYAVIGLVVVILSWVIVNSIILIIPK
jgi:hypothetical protein